VFSWHDEHHVRAFEVEHTTAIYSGILRMADLLALQPNMQIRLHIVAPVERREKMLREIKRPVFSLLDHGPLYEKCTFLSYDAVHAIAQQKFLAHMSDSILDEYEEYAAWQGSQRGRIATGREASPPDDSARKTRKTKRRRKTLDESLKYGQAGTLRG